MKRVIWSFAAFMLLGGCSSGGGGSGIADVPNPYFQASGNVQVETLRALGDSYTVNSRRGSWAEILAGQGRAKRLENYAEGGAQAAIGGPNSFNNQIDQLSTRSSALGGRDLTVAYFGYNDIGRQGSGDGLAAAKAGYQTGVNRLINLGATGGERRLFITQVHDWSKNPGVNSALGGQVRDWNAFVANVANQSPNIVAVDLFTVFERVYANPGAFGLANVSTANRARSASDFLYYDDIHFGPRGANIIARTYNHYLTRGWDWANSLTAGSSTANQLQQDINTGVFALRLRSDDALTKRVESLALGPRGADKGMIVELDGQLGIAVLGLDQGQGPKQKLDATGIAGYWRQEHSGIEALTQVSALRQGHKNRAYDEIVNFGVDQSRDVSSWSLQQHISHLIELDKLTFSPWAAISHHQLSLATDQHRSVYTSPTTVNVSDYQEILASGGLRAVGKPIALSDRTQLQLNAAISYEQSLYRDSVAVSFQETALPGVVQREEITLNAIERAKLNLGASLYLPMDWTVALGYSVTEQAGQQADAGMLTLTRQF
jgi:hypothetical protein